MLKTRIAKRPLTKEERSRVMLWPAVAELAQAGRVTCPESRVLDKLLLDLVHHFARMGAGIADETLASAALTEAQLEVKPSRWRKDGFAYGIEALPTGIAFDINGKPMRLKAFLS